VTDDQFTPDEHRADDTLLAQVSGLFARVDPVPPLVLEAARDSFGWRTIDADLARLIADSLLATTRVRGSAARLLTYHAGDLTIEVEVTEVGGRLRVLGQVVPPQAARVQADQQGSAGERTAEVGADALGRFTFSDLLPGPTRFRCSREGDAPPVHTEWTVL
jgi:hypothetical protein